MRILMLGNSLTMANGLPELLGDRLQAQVVVHARGGARLSEHLNPTTKLGARTHEALAAQRWDYVILQEMSNGPVRFPQRFAESVSRLSEAARANGAIPVLFATWAYAPGCPKLAKLGLTHDEMHERMHETALAAAADAQALPADACLAFHTHPHMQGLYAPDGVHPSPAGTQVALECLAAIIDGHGHTPAITQEKPTPAPDSRRESAGVKPDGAAAGVKPDGAAAGVKPEGAAAASPDAIVAAADGSTAGNPTHSPQTGASPHGASPKGHAPLGETDGDGGDSGADPHPYTVYLLECEDGSYYAGITTDLARRLEEHRSRGPKAAKYTRTHPVAALAASWPAADRAEASRLEYRIKRLTHGQKAALAANPALLDKLFAEIPE